MPIDPVSWRPTASVPTIAGAVIVDGAKCCLSTTGNVWFVMPTSVPAGFVAVIHTRSEKPMSAVVAVYELVVAPAIGTHDERSPGGLQRRHEYVNVERGRAVPCPRVERERLVDDVLPEDLRRHAQARARSAVTGAVDSEFCEAVPCEFVAVT